MSHKKKRRMETTCVYCGQVKISTEEHVVPQCLWPEDIRPKRTEFVIAPVCLECNREKARDDSYVRDVLVVDAACDGNPITEALRHTVRRSNEKNWSDLGREIPKSARLVPGFTPSGIYVEDYVEFSIDCRRTNRFFKLVTRGLYWKKFGKTLPRECGFRIQRHDRAFFKQQYQRVMDNGGNGPHGIGQGVFHCVMMLAEEDPTITYWLICIYDSIVVTVETGPKDYIERPREYIDRHIGKAV